MIGQFCRDVIGCKCPVLTAGRLVKTTPSKCVTSQVKSGTKCSFSCPQGYHLRGPSQKQCGANGLWTASAKPVSCKDTDECAVSNGGCSHKCVNTAGGYKCECPDPELSLSLNKKTCYAVGVDVHCNSNNMTIIIPKFLLRGLDRQHLRLRETRCKAMETSSHFSLTTSLTSCNTTRRLTSTATVYSNTVLEIPVVAQDVVTRVREIEIQFSCFYSKYGVVSSVGWKPNNRKLEFTAEGKGNFTLSMNMFPDKRFVSPYTNDDFPVDVMLRKLLYFEVSVTSSDKKLSIMADRCYATPTQNGKNSLKYEFIKKGCPSDVTVNYHSASSLSAQRFSLEAFKFIADHPFVFVHCHVIVCNATNPASQCVKKCSSSDREKRAMSGHVTNDVYSLAQGPIHLARGKRERKEKNAFDKIGSSPFFMMSFFGMCVAFLAGTALMIVKKSRDKRDDYTLLASGSQEQ
ncbi:Oncoprotein-induced transcript 3 protein [Stylophora pistillata]|uniref:Oncoprotein-induced transcript 3 protein n=1 Tax=Stylophora pistillata TaxID=50429 RepID=A0A2B4S1Z1_STYPI|nr:Oncoprotein-induced transcript 3 protein [Stylophora pistillata]